MIDGTRIAASPKAQIEALEARIATLEATVAMVESRLVFSLMDHAQLKDRVWHLERPQSPSSSPENTASSQAS